MPLKVTAAVLALAHTVWLAGSVTVGNGLMVIVKLCGVPEHPFNTGVIVMLAVIGETPAFVAVKAGILPVPLAANPIATLSLLQLKVALPVPLIVMGVVEALWQKL